MKIYFVQWEYMNESHVCAVMDSPEKAKEAMDIVREKIKRSGFGDEQYEPEIQTFQWELNTIKVDDAGL